MKKVIKMGRTVNEAVELALIELGAKKEDIEIEIIEKDVKGILGVFGTKEAKVIVTLKENAHIIAKEFLKEIFEKMKIDIEIKTNVEDKILNIELIGSEIALLIGKRGQTLDAIQYLVSLYINRNRENYIRIVLDAENYRKKRKITLERLANKMADKAKKLGKDIVLEPMNPYERRIIHSELQKDDSISTKSEGVDPNRRVVIFLKR